MKKFIALGLAAMMTFGLMGCASSSSTTAAESVADTAEETAVEAATAPVKIGVVTYNATDSEMIMFRSYLKDYLGETFNVEYVYADALNSLEDEKAFIDQAKELGCKGIIAFTSYDLAEIVDYCGEDMFYALQNMTPSNEEFEAVKDKPQFLGLVSPSIEDEYEAGADMARSLMSQAGDSSKVWLVFTGGASYGNTMHSQRSQGIMDVLAEAGYELTCSMDDLMTAQAPLLAAQCKDGGQVYICPGYPSVFTENVEQALQMCEADVILSSCSLESNADQIREYEKKIQKDVKLGLVDCFSETVSEFVENGEIDYLSGKYGAMVAPTFVAMMNAIYGDEALVKENGSAYRINQDMWNAASKEEFRQLYSDSVNIYDNTYCADDLMDAIGAYNENANHDSFLALVEGK